MNKPRSMIQKALLLLIIPAMIFSAEPCYANNDALIPVYRWYNIYNYNYATFAEGELNDNELLIQGWSKKTFLFYAYKDPKPNTVAVNRWYNPRTRAYISVCEDEFTDEWMGLNGFTQKHTQYHAPIEKGDNTVRVDRWLQPGRHLWITMPDEQNTDELLKKGYHHKTYQYYGIAKI